MSEADETPAKHHPDRWRLHRAGICNVWFFYDTEFALSGGRLVLRGANGAGKSRALEMLLPFLLDADRRRMDATGSGKVRLEELMRAGGEEQGNRVGYLWLELFRAADGGPAQHLTVGALVKFSRSTADAKVWYFTTPLRVGTDLTLMNADREVLSREDLAQLIGAERITESPQAHRERIRTTVFGLTGEAGQERFDGLRQLLHTLRSPDVGNRIEEGNLPRILADALPPLSEAALASAGEQLDGLSETRKAQQRIEEAYQHVNDFLGTYRRYAAGVLLAAAGGAREAAATARRTATEAQQRRAEHRELAGELAEVAAGRGELEDTVAELDATIAGIKASKEYRDARDLDERERRITALGQVVDGFMDAAGTARRGEAAAVQEADRRAAEVLDAADAARSALAGARRHLLDAGAGAPVPEAIDVRRTAPPALVEPARLERSADPSPTERPQPEALDTTPGDLAEVAATLLRVKDVVAQRAAHAGTRLAQAHELDRQHQRVDRAEHLAADAEGQAERAAAEAAEAGEARHAAARSLVDAWRAWVGGDATVRLLAGADWSNTAVAALLDGDGLPDDDTDAALAALDEAAATAARPVQDRHAAALAGLDAEDAEDAARRRELEQEHARLRAAQDPAPPMPPWLRAPGGGVPLWQAVDFAADLGHEQRAGLEGALLGAGLLTAIIVADGTVTTADGRVLLAPHGPVAATPLSQVLVVDDACTLPPAQVTAVLSRVAVGDRTHPTWVDVDGAWGNGPLSGRHRPPDARHIGAAARAAARRARLSEIEAALRDLDTAAEDRRAGRAAIAEERAALGEHVRTAPRSRAVSTARALADAAAGRAVTAAARHRDLAQDAARRRREWSAAVATHRAACASFGLPYTVNELVDAQRKAALAEQACDSAAAATTVVQQRRRAHAEAVDQARRARHDRVAAESRAEEQWRAWHTQAAEFAAVKQHIGAAADRIRAELRQAEAEHQRCTTQLADARRQERDLTAGAATAAATAATAAEKADDAQRLLSGAAETLTRTLAMRGVAAAATGQQVMAVELAQADPATVEAAVRTVVGALDRRGAPADENTLIRAQQKLERELSGTFDVHATVDAGVRLVELADAAGRRTAAEAAAELHRQRDEGRAALSDRERHVFTNFILGGVAEELRRRLVQATDLIAAMNASLASIRTSHGIGVKVRWNLSDAADQQVNRVRTLVMTAADIRPAEHTNELITLLKARVDNAFAVDQTAGYASHLKAALDYRSWHRVEVIITGPERGRERQISRRAKLSQGETRFVSYVTLFAAIDAYLTSLPDNRQALRFILLDDAFAKVDDRTIGELMGLLVRLDIDFAMTGHALWGCYPQVPALDCYEVRRREGTAAITTHIHWDGRARHLHTAR